MYALLVFLPTLGIVALILWGIIGEFHPIPELIKKRQPTYGLSNTASTLYEEFMALPPANRPDCDILAVAKALDVKHGGRALDRHFRPYSSVLWYTYDCNHESCEFFDAYGLHMLIVGISTALKEQEHKLALSKVSHSLDDLDAIKERLREERRLIDEVTGMLGE